MESLLTATVEIIDTVGLPIACSLSRKQSRMLEDGQRVSRFSSMRSGGKPRKLSEPEYHNLVSDTCCIRSSFHVGCVEKEDV